MRKGFSCHNIVIKMSNDIVFKTGEVGFKVAMVFVPVIHHPWIEYWLLRHAWLTDKHCPCTDHLIRLCGRGVIMDIGYWILVLWIIQHRILFTYLMAKRDDYIKITLRMPLNDMWLRCSYERYHMIKLQVHRETTSKCGTLLIIEWTVCCAQKKLRLWKTKKRVLQREYLISVTDISHQIKEKIVK